MNSQAIAAALRQLLAVFLGDSSDRSARNRAFIYCYSAIGIVLMVGFAIFHVSIDLYWLASVNCLMLGLGALNLAALHKWNNLRVAENVSLVLVMIMLSASFFGSVDSTGPYWFASFPPIVFFLKGLRDGLVWIVGTLLALVGLYALQELGLISTPISGRAIWLFIVSIITHCLVLAAYQAILLDAETRLAKRTGQLTREVLERQSVEETLRRTEEKLRFLAHHDALTGLPNRALFYDRLEQALAIATRGRRRVGVLFLDLDDFKPINDSYGHAAGDELLQALAARLTDELRQTDTVARIGGDEFTVILWDVLDPAAVAAVAEKLAESISRPVRMAGRECRVGVSIGQAVFPDDGRDADELLGVADAAMYRMKTSRQAAAVDRQPPRANLSA